MQKQLLALSAGIVWVLLADTYVALTIKDWPTLIDGILIAKLRVFGAFFLLGTAFLALPALWWCVRTRRSVLTGLLRVFAAATAVALIAMSLTLFVNARELIRVAFGHDPMGQSDVRATQDGELEVRGPLAAGVAKRVDDWLGNHTTHVIHLNSPGGWIMEGTHSRAWA